MNIRRPSRFSPTSTWLIHRGRKECLMALFAIHLFLARLICQGAQFSFANFDGLYGGVAAGFGVNPNAADPSELLMGMGIHYTITTGPINPGGFSYTVQLIHDASDVFSSQSASAELEGRYLMYSGKASFSISVASHKTTDTVMWKVTADRDYGVREQLAGVKLTDVAEAVWKNEGYDGFVKRFGTRFISSWSRNAHLEIVFEAFNLTQQDQQHVDAMIEASGQYAAGSFEAKAKMASEFSSLSTSARTRVNFKAEGIAVNGYFAGATSLTSLDQIQQGIIKLLSDIDKQQGNVSRYYTTPYADVIVGFPAVPPYPEFPELKKSQDAFEHAYTLKLQIEAFRNGPRGPFLENSELDYLGKKTAECDIRLAQIVAWLKQFKQDSSLKARDWLKIGLKLPELIYYAGKPVLASGPRGNIYLFPVFVSSGAEVGAVKWSIQYTPSLARPGEANAVADAVWPSPNNDQALRTTEALNQARGETGSLRRWFEYYDAWDTPAVVEQWKSVHTAVLVDRAGNPIGYAKDANGRYIVPALKVGLAQEPWPGPDGDLTYKMLEARDFGGFQQILKPIDGATFPANQPVEIEARWFGGAGNPKVEFFLDGAKLPGGPFAPGTGSLADDPRYQYRLLNPAAGTHRITVAPAGSDPVGFNLQPISFTVLAPVIAPSITAQPGDATGPPGGSVTLKAQTAGTGPLTHIWQRNGIEVFDSSRVGGSDSAALTISGLTANDAGVYVLLVRNAAGTTTSIPASVAVSSQSVTLTASVSPAGAGAVTGAGTFPAGSAQTVIATANSGYAFTNWTENGTAVSALASYTFTLNANRSLVANFLPATGKATITLLASAGGSATGAGTFDLGTSRTVIATPEANSVFVHWSENGTAVSTAANYTFTLDRNRTLTPIFRPKPITARIMTIGSVSGNPGSTVEIPITLDAQGNENALSFSVSFPPNQVSFGSVAIAAGLASVSALFNTNDVASGRVGVVLSWPIDQTLARANQQLVKLSLILAQGLADGATVPISFGDRPAPRSLSDMAGGDLDAAYTDGSITVAVGFEGDVAPRPGGNLSVQASDATVIRRIVAGLESGLTAAEFRRADCAPRSSFGNGAVNAGDITQVLRYVAGLDPQTPAGGPTAPIGALSIFSLPPGPRQISVSSTSTQAGATLVIPVRMTAQGNENALSFSLTFDPSLLSFIDATLGAHDASASLVVNSQAGNGRVGVVISLPIDAVLPIGTIEVLKLAFTVNSAAGDATIQFSGTPAPRSVSDILGNDLDASYAGGVVSIKSSTQQVPQVLSGLTSLTVAANDPAIFAVQAAGENLFYQWFFNDQLLPNVSGPRLEIPHALPSSSGNYTVRISNNAGASSSSASLAVVEQPAVEIALYAGITIVGSINQRYQIQYKDEATASSWKNLATVTLDRAPYLFIDTTAPVGRKRFYQASLLLP